MPPTVMHQYIVRDHPLTVGPPQSVMHQRNMPVTDQQTGRAVYLRIDDAIRMEAGRFENTGSFTWRLNPDTAHRVHAVGSELEHFIVDSARASPHVPEDIKQALQNPSNMGTMFQNSNEGE